VETPRKKGKINRGEKKKVKISKKIKNATSRGRETNSRKKIH